MNKDLPIYSMVDEIRRVVGIHPITIIQAETAAGKSTQVPQILLNDGARILVTQPRVIAAKWVAERVAQEFGCEIGDLVGYRTAKERSDSHRTRCLFVTDGLAMVRELIGVRRAYTHLVIDEVHEWNENIEILVAWARAAVLNGAPFKLILMSATMEADKLSAYCDGAPIVTVPGRTFPVEIQEPTFRLSGEKDQYGAIVRDVVTLVNKQRNVLVFCPGEKEIDSIISALEGEKLGAKILPLYGKTDKAGRQACAQRYDEPKVIVATNMAQTSITIEDIDAVVDSGMERRIEVHNGVEGLFLRPISRADSMQRRGRAGRCKPGIYIDHSQGERNEFPIPEIQRKRLDQTVLRLAQAGFDLEELELFHQPRRSEIHAAKECLRTLGCLGEGIQVTEIGARVARLPISVRSGRMLIEAEKRGVIDEVLVIVAVAESGGIVNRKEVDDYGTPIWRRLITDTTSDHLTLASIYNRMKDTPQGKWRELGISWRGMKIAMETHRALRDATDRLFNRNGRKGTREDVLKCILIGSLDQLRQRSWGFSYGTDRRRLSNDSAVNSSQAEWVIGEPFDISGKNGSISLIKMVSIINLDWLAEVAPHLISIDMGSVEYDPSSDVCSRACTVKFRGAVIRQSKESIVGTDATEAIHRWMMRAIRDPYLGWSLTSIPHRRALEALSRKSYYQRPTAQFEQSIRAAIGTHTSVSAVPIENLRVA